MGAVFDVAVDLRRSSPTFGRWVGTVLQRREPPPAVGAAGLRARLLCAAATADLVYKCTDVYVPEYDRALRWDDPALAIAWPLDGGPPPLLSAKDAAAPSLQDADAYP